MKLVIDKDISEKYDLPNTQEVSNDQLSKMSEDIFNKTKGKVVLEHKGEEVIAKQLLID